MSDYGQDNMEDIINEMKEEKIREHANEIDAGRLESFIRDNETCLAIQFMDENEEQFNKFAKEQFKEDIKK